MSLAASAATLALPWVLLARVLSRLPLGARGSATERLRMGTGKAPASAPLAFSLGHLLPCAGSGGVSFRTAFLYLPPSSVPHPLTKMEMVAQLFFHPQDTCLPQPFF